MGKFESPEMSIVWLPLDSIFPYPNNPRKNDRAVDDVVKSLQSFGWQQPIVVDAKHEIVAGHTRYLAAKKLGLPDAPCLIDTTLTEKEIKAYRVMDNKSAERSVWDQDKLLKELESLETSFNNDFFEFKIKKEVKQNLSEPWDLAQMTDQYALAVKGPKDMKHEVIGVLSTMEGFVEEITDLKKALKEYLKKSC